MTEEDVRLAGLFRRLLNRMGITPDVEENVFLELDAGDEPVLCGRYVEKNHGRLRFVHVWFKHYGGRKWLIDRRERGPWLVRKNGLFMEPKFNRRRAR